MSKAWYPSRGDTTVVHDNVVYALPFGWIGDLAHKLFVKRQLDQIFAYRRRYMERETIQDELQCFDRSLNGYPSANEADANS
jgi:hypothetical protein